MHILLSVEPEMFIEISNKNLAKSFESRLEALKSSYFFKVIKSECDVHAENYYLEISVDESSLSAFAQDAKFGFGNHVSVERISRIPITP